MLYDLMEKLQQKAHKNSRDKGFWTGPENENIPTKICLIHSELSELLEAFRSGNPRCEKPIAIIDPKCTSPEDPMGLRIITSMEEEAADVFIRLLDLCEYLKIDLATVTLKKMNYNENRPYKHGNKVV